jgi:hypothetical protein
MSAHRPEPRRSALAGVHPATPREQTDTKPAMPATPPRTLAPAPQPVAPPRNVKMTINVPAELVDEAKNAFWADRGSYRSFSAWIAEALQRQIEETMTRHSLTTLPDRPTNDLPPGRPLK